MKSLAKSVPATIAGYVALVVILTAGAAQSLSGSNTVFGDDIVDGTITTPDLKTGSISGSRLLNNGITSAKVYPNTLTGADINESTLELACDRAALSNAPRATFYRVGDICFSPRESATWEDASADCSDEHLRLPSPGEATLVAFVYGAPGALIWTDSVYLDGTALRAVATSGTQFIASNLDTATWLYHCVLTVGATF